MVKEPACYQWSSHLFYKLSFAPPWMDLTKVVQSIKKKTGLNYSEFMSSDINRESWKPALYLSKEGACYLLSVKILCNRDVSNHQIFSKNPGNIKQTSEQRRKGFL